MALEFHISVGSRAPIYQQIVDQIRRAIATGAMTEAEQLPSVRNLAEQLVINPNTVARAYSDLVREGLLDVQHGSGFYVAKRRQIFSREERNRRLNEAVNTFVNEIAFLDFDFEQVINKLKERLERVERGATQSSK